MTTTIRGAMPELIQRHQQLVKLGLAENVRFAVADFGGVRSQADTNEILRIRQVEYGQYVAALKKRDPAAHPVPINEWRKVAPFGSSMHNYGAAFDVEITSVDGIDVHRTPTLAPIWKTNPKRAAELVAKGLHILQVNGSRAGLRAGVTFGDPPHFELPISLADARQRFTAAGGRPGSPLNDLAALFVVVGGGLLLWMIASAIAHPPERADNHRAQSEWRGVRP